MGRIKNPFRRVQPIRGERTQEFGALVSLATPLALTQLSYMAIFTTDVVMMGRLGAEPLAAGSLAAHFYGFFMFFAAAVLSAVAPIMAQDLGARRFRRIRGTFRHGFWLAILLAIPCTLLVWHTGAILALLGQDPAVAAAGQTYLRVMVLGLVPALWQVVLADFLAAHRRPRITLIVTILGILLNAFADYVLMFGHFGFPRFGLVGAGMASAIVNTAMFLALLGFVLVDRRLRRYRLFGRFWQADWPRLFEIVRIGLPMAVTELAEAGMFLTASLLMGLLGTVPLAAHAVAAQCCGVAFMIPLGISQAATVRVGYAIGADDRDRAARSGWTALFLGLGVAFLLAMAFWFFGGAIGRLFLDAAQPDNQATLELIVGFLAVAALFQLGDTTQIIARGALRGLKDTRGPMFLALGGYWGLGLPAAALLGLGLDMGGRGIWIGLALGITATAVLLVRRYWVKSAVSGATNV